MRRLVLGVVVAMAALSGCGGGGGGGGNGSADEQAADALLAVADFGSGWSKAPDEPATVGEDNDFCDHLETDAKVQPKGEAEAEFQNPQGGLFAAQRVALYEDVAQAKEVMNLLRQGVEQCKSFTDTQGGETFTGTMAAATPPSIGEEAVAAKITAQANGVNLKADAVMVRNGRGVTLLVSFGVNPPAGLVDTVAGKAADRLKTALA
jgi:hypothetical protein